MAPQANSGSGGGSPTTEVFGHNTEIVFRGTTYHVQTENIYDDAQPNITTLVYNHGCLVKKLTASYADLLHRADFLDQLKERVRRQHSTLLAQIKQGELA